MKGRSYPKFILGYTDKKTVMLDFDHMPFEKVKYWARKAVRFFKLEGFLILESSARARVLVGKITPFSTASEIIKQIIPFYTPLILPN